MDTRTQFSKKVIKLIRNIPRGKVATYGQIAKWAGKPQGSRGVGWLLHSGTKTYRLPWQRVLNSRGRVSHPEDSMNYALQISLLEREGVRFNFGQLDLKRYAWNGKISPSKKARRRTQA